MKTILITLSLFLITACGYVPHTPHIQPVFDEKNKIDVTYTFNAYGGHYDANANMVANNNFLYLDETIEGIEDVLSKNPMINSFAQSEAQHPDKFHLNIELYFGSKEQGMPQMILSIITLGLIPFYFDLERHLLITVKAPDGFPAGKTLEAITGTAQGGWFTLAQGSSFNPTATAPLITDQISEQFQIGLYNLTQKGAFAEQ